MTVDIFNCMGGVVMTVQEMLVGKFFSTNWTFHRACFTRLRTSNCLSLMLFQICIILEFLTTKWAKCMFLFFSGMHIIYMRSQCLLGFASFSAHITLDITFSTDLVAFTCNFLVFFLGQLHSWILFDKLSISCALLY